MNFRTITNTIPSVILFGLLAGAAPAGAHVVGLWHFDEDFNDSSGYGSTYFHEYSEDWGTPVISTEVFQVGTGSVNSGGVSNPLDPLSDTGVLRLDLSETAKELKGSTEFGLSMWVFRNQDTTGNTRIFAFTTGETFAEIEPKLVIRTRSTTPADQYFITNAGLNGLGEDTNPFSLPFQEWTHIAITADGSTAGLYVNGNLIHSTSITSADGANLGDYIHLGSLHAGSGSYANSFWDDLVLYDGPTDGEWAATAYQLGLAGANFVTEAELTQDVPFVKNPAVKLEFETDVNRSYQLQRSADLQSWEDDDLIFPGTGQTARRFYETREKGKEFYRVLGD